MNISIAMAAYKGERFIAEQLESIARQTLAPFEIVITDDSPDSATHDIVQSLAPRMPCPVRIVHNAQRLGFHENFFKAISLCEGDIVAFCDQDDVWVDNKLERIASAFADPDVMLVTHAVKVVDENLAPLDDGTEGHWSYSGTYAPLSTNPWYVLYGMSAAVRRCIYDYVDWRERPEHPVDPGFPMSHDTWAWFVATSLGKIVALDEPLALYRQHGANACGASPERDTSEKVRLARAAGHEHYRRQGKSALARAAVLRRVSQNAPESIRERAAIAARFYDKLGTRLMRRATFYAASSSRINRARGVLRLLVSGGYRALARGGLGPRALLKDLHATVFHVSAE